ncbi:ABC transporter substrate-binding protein [Pseudophaeobacter sp.]|uniref:ABC transporter substrate-binding protein n=1 Tax=Pseudophaeobacter sp. TaxID=1971739 RepID=UPI00405A171A
MMAAGGLALSASTTFDASSHPIYNRLVEFETGTTNVIPGLAESDEASNDGLEFTFTLRQGVKFHSSDQFTPTRDFTADDVIFAFERQRHEDHPFNKVSGGTWEYFNGMSMPDLVKEIVKVDDHTMKFVLSHPEAPFVVDMAMDFASILSAEYGEAMLAAGTPEMLNTAPIGTGHFSFVAYRKDAVIRYQANADYWQEKAGIDNLIFAITPDASVRYQKLKVGECHVIPYPNPADVAAMKADAGVSYLDMKIWAMPVQWPYNPNTRRMAELIQEDYSKAGVDVEIVSYEWGEYLSRSKDLDRDGAVLLGWAGDNGDPDNFLAALLGCDGAEASNRAQWCHQPFDDVIQKAKFVTDTEERTRLYEEAQSIFKEQAPWATTAHSVVYLSMSNKLQGYKVHPLGGYIFYGVTVE